MADPIWVYIILSFVVVVFFWWISRSPSKKDQAHK